MSKVPLYLFEDPGWRRFGPLTTNRPVWDLRIGLDSLSERISRLLDTSADGFIPRASLDALVKYDLAASGITDKSLPKNGDVFIVNGRAWKNLDPKGLEKDHDHAIWTDGPDVVAARLPAGIARKWLSRSSNDPDEYSARTLLAIWGMQETAPSIEILELPDSLIYWPWEILKVQEKIIREDFLRLGHVHLSGEVDYRAILIEDGDIVVEVGAHIAAGAILDASEGPIIISEGVKVMPGAVIRGPVYIGPNSTIKVGAKLYGPLSIGPVCKLGGEVEDCMIQGYSNKQHEGFLGHALLGEWVNLGADTNNSDLKNNYSSVHITIDGESIDTGETFIGSIIGDHVKTAINTQLNTGTVIGIGSNVFGAGFPPKTIGAYRWGGAEGFELYDFDKFLATAKAVVARRGKELSSPMIALLRQIHNLALENEI